MKTILLIDDNENLLYNTAEILELSKYKVLTAKNGKEGVRIALKENPDLIVCDIMMPELDGYGVLHVLQRNYTTRNTPFIFLTAKTDRSEMRKGMEMGADDYITKPFSGTELLNAVESRLTKAGLNKEDINERKKETPETVKRKNIVEFLDQFVNGRNINRYKKKQTIYSEGNRPVSLFFIVKGKAKTYKRNDNGKELIVGLYNQGDFIGHLALLENANYKETAEAMEETELAIISKEEFDEVINSNIEVSLKFIQMLAKNIADQENQLLSMAYNSLRKKVAEALLKILTKFKVNGGGKFTMDISRDNLAAIAGTAPESFIRTLGDFRNERLIDINEGSITILDEQKLMNLIN